MPLVDRARQKPPPVVSPPPPRSRQATPAPSTARPPPAASAESWSQGGTTNRAPRPAVSSPSMLAAPAVSLPAPSTSLPPDEQPWFLDKSSWRFHRRFYAVFRRPMAHGEYSSLLKQIRFGQAEHLSETYWRVTLSDGRTTLSVVATRWRLVTILPKNWQPPPTE